VGYWCGPSLSWPLAEPEFFLILQSSPSSSPTPSVRALENSNPPNGDLFPLFIPFSPSSPHFRPRQGQVSDLFESSFFVDLPLFFPPSVSAFLLVMAGFRYDTGSLLRFPSKEPTHLLLTAFFSIFYDILPKMVSPHCSRLAMGCYREMELPVPFRLPVEVYFWFLIVLAILCLMVCPFLAFPSRYPLKRSLGVLTLPNPHPTTPPPTPDYSFVKFYVFFSVKVGRVT